MYNKGTVIGGLILFIILVTTPIWYNGLNAGPMPKPELPPGGEQKCVLSASEMRDKHMQLLNEWRDDVLRKDDRVMVTVDGKQYRKGLQTTCMECHTNKEKFCDTCHTYASVTPYCWECHLTAKDIAAKKEAQ